MKKLQNPVDEGWSVHIYDRQRRLLCALEPSHGWIFLLGCAFGLVLAIIWFNVAPNSETTVPREPLPKSPMLQVD
ncbi:MAG: hypothetical protein AAF821_11605 [Cyanobacteria bacterium P01_D01_bin.156]